MNNELGITETRLARRKGSGGTQEFFTPSSLVSKMCDKIHPLTGQIPLRPFSNLVLATVTFSLRLYVVG